MDFLSCIGLGAQIVGRGALDNLPIIQTAFSVVGTIITPIWACKSTLIAKDIIDQKVAERGAPLSKGEIVEAVWPYYIGPVLLGAATCTAEIKTTKDLLGKVATSTALAAASTKALNDYRDKNAELFGESKDRKVRDELAKDKVEELKAKNHGSVPIMISDGEILCIDGFSGRAFHASIETVRAAANDINEILFSPGSWSMSNEATLNDFYSAIGDERNLGPLSAGYHLGWNSQHKLEYDISTQLYDEKTPCVVLTYNLFDLASEHAVM